MFISVVLPFRNARRTLARCLESLVSQSLQEWELIAVDNGSSDGSASIVKEFIARHSGHRIRLVTEEAVGASAARNRGVREAQGDWIAFTDADCIADPEWIEDLAAAACSDDPTIGGVAGRILPADTDGAVGKLLGLYTLPANPSERSFDSYTLTQGGFPTANLMVRRNVFESVGGFDESITIYGEDHVLCMRMYERGARIKAVTNAIVRHVHREGIGAMLRQAFGFGRSHGLLLSRMKSGMLLIETPVGTLRRMRAPRVWLDLNQADKKMVVMVAAALTWWPFAVLPLLYLFYLAVCVAVRARRRECGMAFFETLFVAVLLLLKSGALTCGRVKGAVRYKVFCL